jgi:hypothetical protein
MPKKILERRCVFITAGPFTKEKVHRTEKAKKEAQKEAQTATDKAKKEAESESTSLGGKILIGPFLVHY